MRRCPKRSIGTFRSRVTVVRGGGLPAGDAAVRLLDGRPEHAARPIDAVLRLDKTSGSA